MCVWKAEGQGEWGGGSLGENFSFLLTLAGSEFFSCGTIQSVLPLTLINPVISRFSYPKFFPFLSVCSACCSICEIPSKYHFQKWVVFPQREIKKITQVTYCELPVAPLTHKDKVVFPPECILFIQLRSNVSSLLLSGLVFYLWVVWGFSLINSL